MSKPLFEIPKNSRKTIWGADAMGQVLQGWYEIAQYLRRSVSCVKRWNKEGGLPVMPASKHGRKRRVWTTTSLIDLWIVKNSG